jgi:hypothetical protein
VRTTQQNVVNIMFYAIAMLVIVLSGYQISVLSSRLREVESMYTATAAALEETKETLRVREQRISLLEQQQRTLDFRITNLEREVSQILRGNR